MMICGSGGPDWPDVGNAEVPCCMGAVSHGPSGCTCWKPVYDTDQQSPRTELAAGTREDMCLDCAYRPGSPERTGDPDAAGDDDVLRELVDSGRRFWCHQGMRRVREWRHPCGATHPGSPLDFPCPVVDGVPYKADGTPADVCGGWAALNRKRLAREGEPGR
jgi:hypothetical protein